eukprot:6836973-Prymnesium_polylepis.1
MIPTAPPLPASSLAAIQAAAPSRTMPAALPSMAPRADPLWVARSAWCRTAPHRTRRSAPPARRSATPQTATACADSSPHVHTHAPRSRQCPEPPPPTATGRPR